MVITIVAEAMVIARVADRVCAGLLESFAWNVTESFVTAAVGVPEITPVDAARDSPAGRAPLVIDQLYGETPPVAASDAL